MRDTKHSGGAAAMIPTIDFEKVERLVVFHLDEYVSTPIAVLPHRLERMSFVQQFESTNPGDFRAVYEALLASEPYKQDDSGIDTRWGAIFFSKEGARLFAVYADGFGVQGIVENNVVGFAY